MCGRATLTNSDMSEIVDALDADVSPDDAARFRPRYNIAPSDLHWIVEAADDSARNPRANATPDHRIRRRTLVPAIWGYLPQSSARPLINVRSEQVGSGRGFRDAFTARRCLMVTDGFLEWDKNRSPFWFHRPDGGLVLLAGLYQTPPTGPSDARPRFTVLTTRPNRLVGQVHNRMPVVVAPDRVDAWLGEEPSTAAALLEPALDQVLIATPVSRRVNSVKNDDPECLKRSEARPPEQGSLF